MNGFEIGLILLALACLSMYLSTPDTVSREQEHARQEAAAFRDALIAKHKAQAKGRSK